jgi:hypothetical protein
LQCTGSASDPATCLTAAEADTVNSIWAGPSNARGRIWGGPAYGTSFNTNLPGGNNASSINTTYLNNWLHENPAFDYHTITQASYANEFALSVRKFEALASTDNSNLDLLRNHGGKLIHWHGLSDPLIYPFTSFNYASRVMERYGVAGAQSFMRTYFFPGFVHPPACGTGPQGTNLFSTLVDWVEKGVVPDYVISTVGSRTRKICKYPDQAVLTGPDVNSEASYTCRVVTAEPADLRNASRSIFDPVQR